MVDTGPSARATVVNSDDLAPVIPIDRGRSTGRDDGAVEADLLRRLRSRSLSMREAHAVLAEHGMDGAAAAAIVAEYVDRGYLGDDALAEQIARVAVTRRGWSRAMVARQLESRGVATDAAEAALAALDDDAERAREIARRHAATLRSVPLDAATRRLAGRLQRRGYSATVALDAARSALTSPDPR